MNKSCKTETTMPTKMSEWLIEQMNALESGILDDKCRELILSFLTENVEDPHITAVFEKFKEIKKEKENLKQYEIKCGWCEEQDLDVCCPINCVKNRQDGVELTVCGECWEEMDKKIWYEPDEEDCGCESDDEYSVKESGCDNLGCKEEDEDNCLKCGELRGNHDISTRNYLIPCESDGEEDEDKNLPELSCCRCFKEIVRDSEEHDETHINEDGELICPDCMNGCDCESCLNMN